MTRRRHASWIALAMLAGTASGCIVGDREIQLDENENAHAVKIVEPAPTTARTECACSVAPDADDACPEDQSPDMWMPDFFCPQPSATFTPHIISPGAYQVCSCPAGTVDVQGGIPGFELLAEDLDEKDTLYAALLVDVDLRNPREDPSTRVRYTHVVSPARPLSEASSLSPIGQPQRSLRRIAITDDAGRFDPCKANGTRNTPLDPGFHELTVIVTDREWFSFEDDDGRVIFQDGSPNMSVGASQDTTHYFFQCLAPDVAPCDTRCVDPDADG